VRPDLLWQIAITFGSLSLVAVGGANALVPEMRRQMVDVLGWMSDPTFTNLFALAQAAPGPNVLIVSLLGWHVAGLQGLAVATLAMITPSCLLAFGVRRVMARSADSAWLRVLQGGLVPIAIGLILASGSIMARAADRGALTAAITAATAALIFWTARSPLWALATGALLSVVAYRTGFPA